MKRAWLVGLLLLSGAARASQPPAEPALPTPAWLAAALRAPVPDLTPRLEPMGRIEATAPWDGSLPAALIASLFAVYRHVISPQDMDACTFAPTCSHFAEDAIARHGLVRGVLLGTDRLLRDHPFGAEAYEVDPATGRKQDDLDVYSRVIVP